MKGSKIIEKQVNFYVLSLFLIISNLQNWPTRTPNLFYAFINVETVNFSHSITRKFDFGELNNFLIIFHLVVSRVTTVKVQIVRSIRNTVKFTVG